MRALLIANDGDGEAGVLGERFEHHGYRLERCERESFATWPGLDGVDLVVFMGSEWSVYWDHVSDFVAAEADLLVAAHDRGTPVFAVCFGSQVAAHALGGGVHRAAAKEIGWHRIESRHPAVDGGPWMQWHGDVVTLPPGAIEWATSPVGPQAWELGSVWCTQFHPEVTPAIVERWITGGGEAELRADGGDPDRLLADCVRHDELNRANTQRLVDWFCERHG